MYTLRFANSARPNFPSYTKEHDTLDSVSLEILRISEVVDIGAHPAQVEDGRGAQVPPTKIPTAHRHLEVRPTYGNTREVNGRRIQDVSGHNLVEVTEVDGRYESSRYKGKL